MNILMWSLSAVLLLAAALLLLSWALNLSGQIKWRNKTADLVRRLRAASRPHIKPHTPLRFDANELAGLPEPVRRFFKAALKDGTPIVSALQLQHHGSFNMGEAGEQWRSFNSQQQVLMHRPGFVWHGQIALLPALQLPGLGPLQLPGTVQVHDAYIAGQGLLQASLLGWLKLADLQGAGELARGELMRYLAEAAWYPTALLPSQGVRWQAIDERSAQATLVDGEVSVSLDFHFGADGLIESVRAAARGRTVAGQTVMTPWIGRWFDYHWQDGMQVPMRGVVSWLLPQGPKDYWRGTVAALAYEFAEAGDDRK